MLDKKKKRECDFIHLFYYKSTILYSVNRSFVEMHCRLFMLFIYVYVDRHYKPLSRGIKTVDRFPDRLQLNGT